MISSASRRRQLAVAVSLCFTATAALAEDAAVAAQVLAPVVVTGSRFDADPALAPIGATVISAEEIRRSGASDVNAAIRKIGGVYGRQSLDGSPDFGLDLRGFGTNSSQNMVIVVDGVRLSENELLNAVLSGIPVDSVERIEITRGGASVLYGDGATGGVVNIVTRRPGKASSRGSMFVEGGQFSAGEVRVAAAQAWDGFAADATAGYQRTDNYRDNNEFKQSHFSGGAQWYSADGKNRIGFRYEGARQDMRFAGSLKESEFNANPRQTLTPDDNGSLDYDRLTVSGQYRVAGFDLAADLSYRKKTVESTYVFDGFPSTASYDSKQTQFSPRLRRVGEIGGMLNEVVAGADFIVWDRTTTASYSAADASQHSKALYVRDELRFDAAHEGRVSAGVRRELFDKDFNDPLGYASTGYQVNQGLNAWELQASYMPVARVTVFGKLGQSYRVANADENAATPFNNQPLVPQKSHDAELGLGYADSIGKITGRVFRHELSNEIFYDPTLNFGTNTNLDPTRRQGFELDAERRIAADWSVSAHYQHVQAKFTEGVNDGREMVLVPKNTLTARLSWATAVQSADVGAQWVDSQRYGSDFDNSCSGMIPSYTTLDARYARKFGQWEFALSGQNLADKHYYSQAFACKGGIYPADGRQMKVSARYEF